MPGCCGITGLRMVRVGNTTVGLTGVNAILEALYIEGWSPDDEGLSENIVERLRQAGNYITKNEEGTYGAALRDLFREFYEVNSVGAAKSG
jgi:hypothetical protein